MIEQISQKVSSIVNNVAEVLRSLITIDLPIIASQLIDQLNVKVQNLIEALGLSIPVEPQFLLAGLTLFIGILLMLSSLFTRTLSIVADKRVKKDKLKQAE